MSSDGLTFEWSPTAPTVTPRRGRGASMEWNKPAEMLAEHPNEWAIVFRGDHKNALVISSRIRSGRLAAFKPAGHYESAEENGAVFARYVGEASTNGAA